MRRTGDGESLRASITSSAVCVSAGSPLIEISTSPGSTIFAQVPQAPGPVQGAVVQAVQAVPGGVELCAKQ